MWEGNLREKRSAILFCPFFRQGKNNVFTDECQWKEYEMMYIKFRDKNWREPINSLDDDINNND